MAKSRRRGVVRRRPGGRRDKAGGGALPWVLGAVALGAGAGIALERLLIGRQRLVDDAFAGEPYGRLRSDRSYEVSSFDQAVLVVEEKGPDDATTGAIFLHGYCLDHTIWHHQIKELGGDRRYLYYDARNHGRSRGGRAFPDTKTLARDLLAVMDRSGLERCVLVGHSMGGMTVLEFCRQNPKELGRRVRGIGLVNTTYTDAVKTLFAAEVIGPIERRMRRLIENIISDRRASRAFRLRGDDLSWLLLRAFGFGKKPSPTQVEYLQRLLVAFPSPPLIDMLQGLRRFNMEGALDSVDVPSVIVAGGDDRITTVRASEKMAREIPGARLEIFERAGHMTMMEDPHRFNSLVAEFLDETLARGRRRRRAASQ